jgi:hypothetical protein
MICRPFVVLLVALNALVMNLSANDSLRFEFLADKAELLSPAEIVAPDLSGQKVTQGFVLLAKLEKGKVQSVEVVGAHTEITSRIADVLKTWQFSDNASGRFLLLGRIGEPLPTSVHAIESLDNKPNPRIRSIPSYPRLLRAVIPWKAVVEVIVDQNGTPVSAKVLSSSSANFVENACVAGLLCRFEIGLKDGSPVCYKTQVEISFDATQ